MKKKVVVAAPSIDIGTVLHFVNHADGKCYYYPRSPALGFGDYPIINSGEFGIVIARERSSNNWIYEIEFGFHKGWIWDFQTIRCV